MKPVEPVCKATVDIGFILDSSGSLRADYSREKDFLKTLAATFGIGPSASRSGVVTFSYLAEHSIKMNDHDNLSDFNDAVDAIPLMGSQTRIDTALRLAQKELFTLANGARPGIPKILILLTDGSQTKSLGAEDPGDIADEIRATGIKIMVVGIGKNVNESELLDLAGGEKNNLFNPASFDELVSGDFVTNIQDRTCAEGNCYSYLSLMCTKV